MLISNFKTFFTQLLDLIVFLLLLKFNSNTSKANYFKVEENTAIDEKPDKVVSAKSFLQCLQKCSMLGYFVINTDIEDGFTKRRNCRCYRNMHCLKQQCKAKWKLVYKRNRCHIFPICKCNECSQLSTDKHFNGLPCHCFLGELCLSVDGIIHNLAVEGNATSSSTYKDLFACRAIDGLLDRFTHTNEEAYPWIAVQLKAPSKIYKVIIYNRNVYWHKIHLNPLRLQIGNSDEDLKVYVDGFDASKLTYYDFSWDGTPAVGRYVKLQVMKSMGIMNLLELLIYGHYV